MTQTPTQIPAATSFADAVALMRQLNHDLRSPLNAITATNDMMLEGAYGEISPKQTRAAERIKRNSARLLTVLDHFVLYIKATADQLVTAPADFILRDLVEIVQKPVRALLAEQDVAFEVKVAEDVPDIIQADLNLWRMMLEALCWNAVAFTEAGAVHLEVAVEQMGTLRVDVRDTGTGITPEIQAQLFTPFCKGDSPLIPVPTSGSGLGLAMAQALAKLLGGQITLVKTGPEGSHFRLLLAYR